MPRRLPPLNAIRAFEAAGRHLSFTRAAGELHVTQAAISHQVRALEEWGGVPLFDRGGRGAGGLGLTPAGRALLPPAGEALDILDHAARVLTGGDQGRTLNVTTMGSFAAAWLVPRMRDFRERNPGITLRIETNDEVADFVRDDIDVGIRYGRGNWPGLHAERLFEEDIFPVCSPALLEGADPLRRPEDLARHTLLHDDMSVNWEAWLRAAGIEGVDASAGPWFRQSHLVSQAAIAGDGVALGRSAIVADALADGRLVRPFRLRLPAEYAYYFICLPGALERPAVRAFRDWLVAEAAAREDAG